MCVVEMPSKPSKELIEFGRRMAAARKAAGLSQTELGEKVELHRVSIARLERGHIDPSLTTLHVIAAALGIPANEFLPPAE